MNKQNKILILGTGGWGTALSILLHNKGLKVTLWGSTPDYVEFLKKIEKTENISRVLIYHPI